METKEIIDEIRKLSFRERLRIIETTAKTIHLEDDKKQMEMVAEELYNDYKNNPELTVFTDLDLEDFYETR